MMQRPRFSITKQTPQQWLTWSLVAMMVFLVGSRLLEQNPTIVSEIIAIGLSGGVAIVVGWQQWQLRRLQQQLHLIQRQLQQQQTRRSVKTTSPAAVSHVDTEHFFQQGQTKH